MTVVIVGVLATLASYGVRLYVAHSKTAEATNALGAIGQAVSIAFYKERMSGNVLALGQSAASTLGGSKTGGGSKGKGAVVTHDPGLCGDSTPVPASITQIRGKKYQPSAADYESGDDSTGWACLDFSMEDPQYYQYQYQYLGGLSAGHPGVVLPHGGSPKGLSPTSAWAAVARGDLNGNGVTSWFVLNGAIEGDVITTAPSFSVVSEDE